MNQKYWVIILATILLSGCTMPSNRSGIEIRSTPDAKVYIDGKDAGMTPYNNKSMKTGQVNVKLMAGNNQWSKTVHTESGASTVINHEFGNDSENGGGFVLYFEPTGDKKKAAMLISTNPDKATIKIDDEVKGQSPFRIDDIGMGDKKLTVSFPGYKNLNTFVKFINGYQLVVEAELVREDVIITPEITDVPIATNSAGNNLVNETKVIIKETETGWLRVRDTASSVGTEVAKVYPNSEYKLLEENNGWYKIDLGNDKSGWISTKYAEKKTNI